MNLLDKIQQETARLPEHLQKEILDFVEFLSAKQTLEAFVPMNKKWEDFSLKSAMRGMESEDTSEYENISFKEKWQ